MWLKNWKPPTIISKFVSRSLRITSPVRIKNYDQKKKCSVCLGRTPDPCSPAPLCHGVCRSLIYAAGGGCYRMFGSKHKYKFFSEFWGTLPMSQHLLFVISIHPSTQALQPMQGLGRLKKSPPTISVHGLDPPISDSQPLCIPRHSIQPSEVWYSHSPSALRFVQGDFLTW
jgi:hypothetical protein